MFKPKARRYSMHLCQCNSIHIYAKGVKTLLRYSKYLQFFFPAAEKISLSINTS